MTDHQQGQIEVINQIESEVHSGSVSFSHVAPAEDYAADSRMCLTGVHIPSSALKQHVLDTITAPLQATSPEYFYYPFHSLHMTVKNVRVINDPPHFTEQDIATAKSVYEKVIKRHKKFQVYFYRLLLFPANLALIGTTDPELDSIILDLDQELKQAGVPDDKVYLNDKYFFSNMTLVRFAAPLTNEFKQKIDELSSALAFEPYTVDSVTLLTCNAALMKKTIRGEWRLS